MSLLSNFSTNQHILNSMVSGNVIIQTIDITRIRLSQEIENPWKINGTVLMQNPDETFSFDFRKHANAMALTWRTNFTNGRPDSLVSNQ